jgi:hypothetical protein
MGQGRENACLYLRERPEIAAALAAKITDAFGVNPDKLLKKIAEDEDEA